MEQVETAAVTAGLRGANWDPALMRRPYQVTPCSLQTADDQKTLGFLFTATGNEKTVVSIMHPREMSVTHYLVPAVLDAGCACWLQGPRSIGNDLRLEHEIALLDVAAGMQHLRALGYRDGVLLGNSDGGALYAFYNQQSRLAPAQRLARTPAGRPTGLAETELMPAGEFILVSPHPGQSAILLNSLDASVVDESDPFSTDPSLETIRPKGALPGVRYPDEARLREYLGMTEGVIMFAQEGDPAYALDESVGRPVSAWNEVKIVEIGSETEVPDGETGEALFRGPYTIAGLLQVRKGRCPSLYRRRLLPFLRPDDGADYRRQALLLFPRPHEGRRRSQRREDQRRRTRELDQPLPDRARLGGCGYARPGLNANFGAFIADRKP